MRKANRWRRKAERRADWGRRLSRARWARPQVRELDADTVRWWALDGARGRVLRHGVTYRGDGTIVPWEIRRSQQGRTDQLDIIANGELVNSMGCPA